MTHIKGFNALRAFSVALVVLTHLDLSEWIPGTDFVMTRVWPMISGDFGVQVFFVLSGFLITRILLNEREKRGKISFRNFFARRFIRLLPPLLLFFTLIGIANLFGYLTNAKESILYAIFYAYNYVPHHLYSFEMGHLWSLGVEEQFYLLWPFVLTIFSKTGKLVFFILVLVAVCCGVILFYKEFSVSDSYFVKRWFIPASCPILVGCLGAVLNHVSFSNVQRLMQHKAAITAIILLTYSFPLYAPVFFIPLGIFVQSIAVITLLLLIVHSQETKVVQALEFRPIAYIGIISYGIYVYQGFFLRTGGGSELWFQQFPANILFTLTLAVLSYELIEKPVLKLKRKFE